MHARGGGGGGAGQRGVAGAEAVHPITFCTRTGRPKSPAPSLPPYAHRELAIIVGLLILAGLIYLVADWYSEKMDVEALQTQLDAMKSDVTKAHANLDRIHYARLWFDDRPPVLDCARDLTLAFPSSGQVWSTSLTISNDDFSSTLSGTLEGKSQSQEEVLRLLDHLRGSKRFQDVKLKSLQQLNNSQSSGGQSNSSPVMSFILTFSYPDPR